MFNIGNSIFAEYSGKCNEKGSAAVSVRNSSIRLKKIDMMKRSVKNLNWLLVMVSFFALGLNGCLKTSDVQPPKVYSYVSVLHLSPSSPAAEVYLDNVRATGSMPVGSFFESYSGIEPGAIDIKFKKGASDSVIASIPLSLYDSLKFYTVVLYDDPANSGTARAAKILDDFSGMTSDKASLRFFNMSPDAGDVDFYIGDELVSGGRSNADNVSNAYLNVFQSRATGSFTFKVKKSGTNDVLAEGSGTLSGGNAYTFFLKGLATGTGTSGLTLVPLRAINY